MWTFGKLPSSSEPLKALFGYFGYICKTALYKKKKKKKKSIQEAERHQPYHALYNQQNQSL